MLDIKVIRQDPERVKAAMKSRNKDMDKEIDEILEIDVERRAINAAVDNMKAEQNRVSKLIPQYKKEGKDVAPILAEMKELSDKITEDGAKLAELEEKQDIIIHAIPNIPHESVPIGKDDTENVELRRWGEPTHFDYEPQAHWDLGADLGILDPETAAKVTGKRFHFYRGLGCRLERSIIAFFMDTHSAHGYTEIFPPFIANKDSMTGTGQLPKFAEDMYKLEGLEEWEKRLSQAIESQYPAEFREMVIDLAVQLQGKVKDNTPVKTGHLRNEWHVGSIEKRGNEYYIEVYNNVEYVEPVEYGHQTRGGKGFVKGAHMMELSLQEVQKHLPGYLREWMNDFLNTHEL